MTHRSLLRALPEMTTMHAMTRNAPAWAWALLTTTAEGPRRRDAVLVGAFMLLALLEGVLRTDLTLPVAIAGGAVVAHLQHGVCAASPRLVSIQHHA